LSFKLDLFGKSFRDEIFGFRARQGRRAKWFDGVTRLYGENHFATPDEVAAKNQKLQQNGISEEVYCCFSFFALRFELL